MIEPMPIRVFFSKTDRAKYISHLDMSRCIQRSFKRADLPVWYTQGFNPHIYLTFALPISLGHESICESMDLKLVADIDNNLLVEKLNKALPVGLVATRASKPEMKPEKICWAEYNISVFFEDKAKAELLKIAEDFFARKTIIVLKKTKKLEKEIDLKPLFKVVELIVKDGEINFTATIAAGISLNINPTLIINELCTSSGLEATHTGVKRLKVLTEDMEEFK